VAMCQAWLSLREQLACCALVLMQTLAAAECGRGWACRPVLTTLYACLAPRYARVSRGASQ